MKNIYLIFIFTISCFGIFKAQETQSIQAYLTQNKTRLNLQESDFSSLEITSQSFDKATEITHVYVRQTKNNVPIFNGTAMFAFKNKQVVYFANRFVKNIDQIATSSIPAFNEIVAISKTALALNFENSENLGIGKRNHKNQWVFDKGTISRSPIPVKLVYFQQNNSLFLAWDLSIHEIKGINWWSIRLDAITGNILEKTNWTNECGINHTHESQCNVMSLTACPPPPGNAGTYRVVAIPNESVNHGPRTLENEGIVNGQYNWHLVNGVYENTTSGNNVSALHIINDTTSNYYSPIESGYNFDYTYVSGSNPATYIDASITNVFYINNMMHDVWNAHGFDEANGNFQNTNFSGAGFDADPVFANVQDSSITNNAYMSTPPDGQSGYMNMALWYSSAPIPDLLTVLSPALGNISSTMSSLGNQNYSITANIILADDATAPLSNACEPIVNNITGKIVLIDRGVCNFVDKLLNAQNNGAIAVIIVNNVTTAIFSIAVQDPMVTIPSIMISQADGVILKNALLNGPVAASMVSQSASANIRDTGLDNGIVIHEYTHGISNRLTGGPDNTDCLGNEEQMGEGWSDWFALMMTIKTGDVSTTGKGIGTFVLNQPITGLGIRPARYSTDLAINNYTYGDVNNSSLSMPHGIGFVWCTMLWDLTWDFIAQDGFNPDLSGSTGGNNKMMKLVVEGLKLQPCGPGFVDGRDAILAADQLLYNGANQCLIWNAFAARGLGFSADQGDPNSRNDQTEAFDLPPSFVSFVDADNDGFGAGNAQTTCGFIPAENVLSSTDCDDSNPSINPDAIEVIGNTIDENCDGTLSLNVSLNELSNANFTVYPNPSSGVFIISGDKLASIQEVEITDLNGRVLKSLSWKNEKSLDLSEFSNGSYFLVLQTDNGSFVKRIVLGK